MSDCNHDCESCSSKCSESMLVDLNEHSTVKKVIGIVSGKGGVGKSLVTSLFAVATSKLGKKTAILDADITGPSIPKSFGIKGGLNADAMGAYPALSKGGIQVVSSNLLLTNESDPIIWRGSLISNMVRQFWTDIIWDNVDFMYIDMPPGTGDVPLTVFQSIKVDGIVIVTSPQELVSMIVEKAVNMANAMNIPILGIVENMSYFTCPDCGKQISIFGDGKVNEVAKKHNLKVLAKIPIDPNIAKLCDAGDIESIKDNYVGKAVEEIVKTI